MSNWLIWFLIDPLEETILKMKVPCEGFTPKEQKTSQHRGVFYWGPSFKIINFSFLIQVLVFYLILGESFEILFLAVFYLKIIFIDFEIRNKKRFNPFPLLLNSRPFTHPPK